MTGQTEPTKIGERLPIEPQVLSSIASEFGTPTYVYLERIITDRIRALQHAVGSIGTRLLYAMKANSNVDVLETIRAEGVGIDAVSPAEGALALKLGFEAQDIFFSGNNLSDDDLSWAIEHKVLINVGEETTLERVAAAAPGSDVCIRVNLEVGAGHHAHVVTGGRTSKFGVIGQSVEAALARARSLGLQVVGLHQHIGSGNLSPEPYIDAVGRLTALALATPGVRFVNFGGGLGIPYKPGERPMDLDKLEDGLRPYFRSLGERDIDVWMEPGRFFVAEAGLLLVQVTNVKDRGGIVFAGTNSGMNHLIRPPLYDAYHEIVNVTRPDAAPSTYDVVGNICETGDFLARGRSLASVHEGDVLAVLDSGAYAMSMANEYNLRPLPAEVFVTSDGIPHLSRRREAPDELAERHFRLSGFRRQR